MENRLFSDPAIAPALIDNIHRIAAGLPRVRIMEVCGTHTMEIGRLGLRSLLPSNIQLISGPGCPVCITPHEIIDSAIDYACRPDFCMTSFGDMVRVPGTSTTLDRIKAEGGSVEIVTSPVQVLDMARARKDITFVFAAVGFETTIPAIARTVELAAESGLTNVKMLVAHRILPPALEALCSDPDIAVSGFLLPGHVSAILGADVYKSISALKIPAAITGFAPLDILAGIHSVITMLSKGNVDVTNMYPRIVRPEGNPHARALINRVFAAPIDATWRGIGIIPKSGLTMRDEFKSFEAPAIDKGLSAMPEGCACGNVLKGIITPKECPLFDTVCTPQSPVGPCMVSGEGSCAAYHRYERNLA